MAKVYGYDDYREDIIMWRLQDTIDVDKYHPYHIMKFLYRYGYLTNPMAPAPRHKMIEFAVMRPYTIITKHLQTGSRVVTVDDGVYFKLNLIAKKEDAHNE